MSLALAGGIAAGASLLGGWLSSRSQRKANSQNQQLAATQNEYNKELQRREFDENRAQSQLEYERNLEQWRLQNEYNSPSAQMQRYSEAGLNPNLIYGTGSASAGNATASPQYSAAKYNAPRAERATANPSGLTFDPSQTIATAQQLALQRATKDNLTSQTEYTRAQSENAKVDNALKALQVLRGKVSYRQESALESTVIAQAKQNLQKGNYEIANLGHVAKQLQSQYNLNEAQLYKVNEEFRLLRQTHDINEFTNQLKRIGINEHDSILSRLAARILLSSGGSSIKDLFNF